MSRIAALPFVVAVIGINVSARAEFLYASLNNNTVVAYDTAALAPEASTVVGAGLGGPQGLAFDYQDNLYVANSSGTIDKVSRSGVVSQFASGFGLLYGIAFNPLNGELYAVDEYPQKSVYKFTSSGMGSLVVSGLANPDAVAFDPQGNLYIANFAGNSIDKITPYGTLSVFANKGLNGPDGLAIDSSGNLYVANDYNDNILKINPSGAISQFVGGLDGPKGLAFDSVGNLFVADRDAIEKITPDGVASVFVTTASPAEYLAFGPAPSPSAVPEPSGLVLIALGLVSALARTGLRAVAPKKC